ncbi:DUF3592 domain-containing protein [Chamaesiphon sp. VAR_48_metabat_403]|uniref:DUF3592 domain-containing protein n=1 Tax=Chamaesiphon sp. VAR_48_metabat_403 TaxID=2964700 RepID=UPI00286E8330|nr:DUF3592 domain-containing protein [Chamaesiphon sp. VAR_48_metabat_403]
MLLGNLIIILLICAGFAFTAWLFLKGNYHKRLLRREGRLILATVTEVRDDRADMETVVTYEFADSNTGRTYSRTSVLQRHVSIPIEGEKIEVIYSPRKPSISRLKNEVEYTL